jgi:hypothetical protein
MIRIKHVRLPAGMQVFARREDGSVVLYVSAELPAGGRAAAIRRALSAAPEAGWRSPRSPVLLPALAGGAGLRLAPDSRWTYRALFAAVAAGAAALIAMVAATALTGAPLPRGGGSPPPAALAPPASGPAHRAVGPDRAAPGSGSQAGPASGRSGSAAKTGKTGKPGKSGGTGGAPAPQTSGRPVPVPTTTTTATSAPSPQPQPSSTPAPTPSPSQARTSSGGSAPTCIVLLGIGLCL